MTASFRFLAALVLLILASSTATSQALAGRKVALVIGNSTYRHLVALTNPRNDAEDVSVALRDIGFEVMTRMDIEKTGLRSMLKDFARLVDGAETTVVFYAGHALQYRGKTYMVPIDSALDDEAAVKFDMLSSQELAEILSVSPSNRIMIFDACRNDPFASSPADRVASKTPPGTLTVFATAPFDVAEDGRERNSPFTRAFLAHVRTPGVEATRLFATVGAEVAAATGGRQTPEVVSTLVGDVYFDRTVTDATVWPSVRNSAVPAELSEFLARFPQSRYGDLARWRLDMLRRQLPILEEARRKKT